MRDWREATIAIVRGGRSAIVRPATLPARHHLGGLGVRLLDLWLATHLEGRLEGLWFDFLGEGGYRASRNGCAPLHGPLLAHGYLQLEPGRIEWEPTVDLECGYRVKGLTMMVAHELDDLRTELAEMGAH